MQRPRGRNKLGDLEEQKEEPRNAFGSGHSQLHPEACRASHDLAFTYLSFLLSEFYSLGGSCGLQVECPQGG